MSALFAGLDRENADPVVCDAYGHAPLFEDIFGGATRLAEISSRSFVDFRPALACWHEPDPLQVGLNALGESEG